MRTVQMMSDWNQGYMVYSHVDPEDIKFESIEFKRGYQRAEQDDNKTELRSIENEYASN